MMIGDSSKQWRRGGPHPWKFFGGKFFRGKEKNKGRKERREGREKWEIEQKEEERNRKRGKEDIKGIFRDPLIRNALFLHILILLYRTGASEGVNYLGRPAARATHFCQNVDPL